MLSKKLNVIAITAMSLLASNAAFAVKRHCQGSIFIEHNGTERGLVYITGAGEETLPNNARKEARQRINRCFRDQYDARWYLLHSVDVNSLPDSCTSSKISGYSFGEVDIKSAIARNACARWGHEIGLADDRGITVRVKTKTWGDTNCSSGATLSSSYRVNSRMCQLGW